MIPSSWRPTAAKSSVLVFTGTLAGLTELQLVSLDRFLGGIEVESACHGMAVGADFQFHQLCQKHGIPVQGHPGDITAKRAVIPATEFAVLMPEARPLVRNRDMVNCASLHPGGGLLVACPKADYEELRSGTWATVRYARACAMEIVYIWPSDGALEFRVPGSPHYHSKCRLVPPNILRQKN